ncbi:hypothetical protein FOPG_18833 [Fusarium oxysporum f. sp. conglutinans race 2 54008]|uniref:Uncharacterized protein n=1 Tax=Fusarium oxysporum f. sp. conglutinans race 2 54008 TaxID=1089457 RepID=X0GYN7_FUSOX|nr:hypothetical protein FOPG_18833 [Fusarium oxysporum f. sp. conglutinans race 2 54008]
MGSRLFERREIQERSGNTESRGSRPPAEDYSHC